MQVEELEPLDCEELSTFLETLQLSKYIHVFAQNQVNMRALVDLQAKGNASQRLQTMGIFKKPREMILSSLATLGSGASPCPNNSFFDENIFVYICVVPDDLCQLSLSSSCASSYGLAAHAAHAARVLVSHAAVRP